MKKVLLPLIRTLMPAVMAKDIVSVQPMVGSTANIFNMNGDRVGIKKFVLAENQNECVLYPGNHVAVDIRYNTGIIEWLEEQPAHLWKFAEETGDLHVSFVRCIMDEQLFTLLALRWT